MAWGLSSSGWNHPTLEELIAEREVSYRAALGAALDTSADSVFGIVIGIESERELLVWDAARDVWQSGSPGGADGVSLTILASGTGTLRKDSDTDPAGRSTVTATVNLDAATTLPAGSVARTDDETALFETLADATNSGGSPADVDVAMRAVDPGPIRANAGTLTTRVTSVTGWNSITNALDAVLGISDEGDTDLRLRREEELRAQGSAALDAIRADVGEVSGVLDVFVEENNTDATVGSLTPHSIHVVIWDGATPAAADDDVAQAMWSSRNAAVQTIGADSGTATDVVGDSHTMNFDRATGKDVYLEIDLDAITETWPVDGVTQVKDAVVDYADGAWSVGDDVILSALYAPVFGVSGLYRITALRAGFTASPSGTADLTIAADEVALADTGRIVVNVTLV